MTSSMTPSPASAPHLVFAEEVPPPPPRYLLRKMIVEKISDAEVVVASVESSIAEKERLIGENLDTLAGSREEIRNLRKRLAILDSMSEVVPSPAPGSNICQDGICTGMTWDEAKKKITENEGHKFWQEWVHKVNWDEAKCQDGICTGMTWYEAKMKITENEGHKFWQEWVHKVNWGPRQVPRRRPQRSH
jgi:hypothetical protein